MIGPGREKTGGRNSCTFNTEAPNPRQKRRKCVCPTARRGGWKDLIDVKLSPGVGCLEKLQTLLSEVPKDTRELRLLDAPSFSQVPVGQSILAVFISITGKKESFGDKVS